MKKIRIGSGAGYAGDRIEPAVELMEKGNLDYIIFECLAERTIAIGQQDIWTTLFSSVWRNAPLRSGSRTKRKIRRRDTTSCSTTEWKKFSR